MENITKEHILNAIQEIDANPDLRKGRASSTYDLIYEGKDYPPKLVISIANRYATGKELGPNEFGGGENTKAFEIIRKHGFVIEKKKEMLSLIEKAKSFAIDQDHIDRVEALRLEFITKFPIDQLKNLTIEQYSSGTGENSFCYWLEFKKILFGIGGGNASKFGLYKSKDGAYITDAGKNKKVLTGDALNQQFALIKNGIIQALEFTKENNIAEIRNLEVPMWNMVLQKILAIYFPEKFIMVGASDVIIECARDIQINNIDLDPNNLIQINYECRKKISETEFFKDWGYEKIGTFIWQTYYGDSKRNYYILGSKYGDQNNIDVFPKMLEKSVVAVGFGSKLDLTEYFHAKPNEIAEFLEKKQEEQKSINALKHFLGIKVGDRIAIKSSGSPKGTKGFLSIVGIAEVIENDGKIYEYDPEGLGHLIHVKYLQAPVYKEFELGGYGSTIHKLSKPEHIELIFKGEYSSLPLPNNDFNKLLSKYEKEDLDIYFNFLRNIISHFNLQPGDERIVFSIRDNNLNFTVGQRYCWNIFYSKTKGKFGVISKTKISPLSGRFDGPGEPPYYTYVNDIEFTELSLNSIYTSIEEELKRTEKSGFRKYNNLEFENYVFNLSLHFNTTKINYKAEFTLWLNKIYSNDSGMKSSYLRAMDILSEKLGYDIYELDDLSEIDLLYKDILSEQKNENGKYYHKEAPSYGLNGYYSAAINKYSDFLKQYGKHNSMNPLNTILYGPPGTGKTFNSINKAISIVNPSFNTKQDRKLVKEEFDRLEKENRILFSTFHQSMSYEDFIEGIKPLPPKPNEPLNYDIQAGIFKIACARAAYLCHQRYNLEKKHTKVKYTFDDLYQDFIESIRTLVIKGQFPIYKTITGKDVEIFEINSQDSIRARAKGSNSKGVAPLTQENLEKLYNKFNSITEIKNLDQVKETVEVTPRLTEFYAVFGAIKEFEKNYSPTNITEENEYINTIDDGEKVKKFTAGIYNQAIKQYGKEAEAIVLIIDEINRGNVSQIFGELITLIEDDKRIGKSESLEVILPYSKLKFGVPPNLHLVGTMNTADRSVEALDTALRRRFSFIEMMPDYSTINKEVGTIKLSDLLFTINKRLAYLINEDHQIGHSYFISVDSEKKLRMVFKNNIIPLLKEYFYNDVSKIQLVLGEGFVKTDKSNKPNFAVSDQDIIDKEVYKLELINDDFKIIEALTKLKIEAIA